MYVDYDVNPFNLNEKSEQKKKEKEKISTPEKDTKKRQINFFDGLK